MGVRQFKSKRLGRDTWGFDARIRGRRVQKTGFSTKKAAELALANARVHANEVAAGVRIEPEQRAVVSVRQVIERRKKQLPVPAGSRGYSSRKQAARNLDRFLAWLSDPGMDVRDLQTAHLAAFRDDQLAKGLLPQSVLNVLTPVMSTLHSARENFPALDGWQPPAWPKLTLPKGKKQVVYAPDTAAELLAHLRRPRDASHPTFKNGESRRSYRARLDAADYLQMALQSGLRGCELRARSWADVVWHRSALRVDNTKAGDEGTVYLPESLLEMLRRRRERQSPESPWIFPNDLDSARHHRRGYGEVIRAACETLGIPWGYKASGGVVLHTTRHTAATAMLDEGWDVATVQSQMRWSDRTMLLNYGHATTRSRRGAATALDKFAGGGGGETVSALVSTSPAKVTPLTPMSRVRGKKAGKKTGHNQRKKRIS